VFFRTHEEFEAVVTAGKRVISMAEPARDTDTAVPDDTRRSASDGARPARRATAAAARPARRDTATAIRLSQRDIDGLLLVGEHYGAPFDLLGEALRASPDGVSRMTGRWRRAGYAVTGRLGPGPGWCWLTRDGMAATVLGFPVTRLALGRLAHIRAVLAARLWLRASPGWQSGQAWWHSERRLRAARPAAGRGGHIPDAEIRWPSIDGSPYAGQVWAVEVELTPKPADRTAAIMTGLLSPLRYAQVVYLTAPAARPVVTRAAASLPPGEQAQIAVRDLPAAAFAPEPRAAFAPEPRAAFAPEPPGRTAR
jgi:hypothetical protein